ncbi:LysR family transcriptional regulator [Halotalea alkalilenta]|uniref:LysR family transcriptional regulator n=1 Tax=Halotalea alkalilenta TaxID=376489 RepID=UPI0004846201|nr:LysR family transcriptional regulator [Halotalea alkalilenta]
MSRITLAQWQMLAAVADHGGFAKAAEAIHKSPSTINHAVHKLEQQLGVRLLVTNGRQVRLTEAGSTLLRRARQLLEGARALEALAVDFSAGTEAEIAVGIDQIFPVEALARALDAFSQRFPQTRVQLYECVLNGGPELLLQGRIDLLVTGITVQGFLGTPLASIEFIAAAHPAHPLHALGRPLDLRDLRAYRQIVIRDSARREPLDSGWLGAEQRWTVGHASTGLEMLRRGLGFAWVTRPRLNELSTRGELLALPLTEGARREVPMQLYFKEFDGAGPATRAMAELLTETVAGCMESGEVH